MKNLNLALLAFVASGCVSSCGSEPAKECLARGAQQYNEGYTGLSKLQARFNELNPTQSDKVEFFKRVLGSGQFKTVSTCQYGDIDKDTDLSKLEPFQEESQCMAWPYRVETEYESSSRERYDRFVETICSLEKPGVIEFNKIQVVGNYHYRTEPPVVLPPPTK